MLSKDGCHLFSPPKGNKDVAYGCEHVLTFPNALEAFAMLWFMNTIYIEGG